MKQESPHHRASRLSVSVIIPTYNRAAYLRQAIDSALSQTRVPDEIVVVDDGSTDETPAILQSYGSQIRMIRQPNRGRSAARNEGLRAATSDAAIFLDSDDMLMPQCIERCAQTLEQRSEVDVVYSDAFVTDVDGRVVARYSQVFRGRRPSGMVFSELARRCFLTVSSMVRRSSLAGAEFEEGMEQCEDYDLWRRLAARCQFQFLDEPLLAYRFHEGMTVASQDRETQENALEVQRRFMAMPEFAALSRSERARFYCAHGIKHEMLDRTDVARDYFRRAARVCPTYPGSFVLIAVGLLGSGVLRKAIVLRRQAAGNQIGTHGGPLAVVRGQNDAPRNLLPRLLNDRGRSGLAESDFSREIQLASAASASVSLDSSPVRQAP